MSRYYDMTSANPPTYDSSPAAVARFWDEFHSAGPQLQESFRRRHPGCVIPEPIDPNAYYDSSMLTFTPDDHRYADKASDVSAEIARRAAETKKKLDAAAAELQRRVAVAQKQHDAHQAVARDLFYEYHRVKDAPSTQPRAQTCAEVKEMYIAARGFDPRSTVELDKYNQPTFRLNGYSREAWARATDELDTNARARHEMYVQEAKVRNATA